MLPDRLGENPVKSNWSHSDCFSNCPLEYIKAFIHKSYTIGMHTHNFYEINIVLSGTGRHYIENKFCDIETGCVFVIPPNIRHGYMQDKPLDVYHILISSAFMGRYAYELENLPGYSILFEIEPYLRSEYENSLFLKLDNALMDEIRPMLEALLNKSEKGYGGCNVIKNAHTLILIGTLCRYMTEHSSANRPSVRKGNQQAILFCMEYIHSQYPKKITLDTLSEICHLSRSTLLRNFETMCKCSPIEYLNGYRLKKARELMLSTDSSLTDIAVGCGFYDQSHFSKAFSKAEHMTPAQYKNKNPS